MMLRCKLVFVVVLASMLVIGTSARAAEPALHSGASLVTGMVGYATHKSELSSDQIGGGTWSVTYGRVNSGGDWSAGLALTRIETAEEFVRSDGVLVNANYARLVPAVQGRFFPSVGRLSTYLGLQLGLHLQTGSGTVGSDELRDSNQTFAFGATAGAMAFISSSTFLQASYVFYYFSDSATIKNNHMHTFFGGLGFQFGVQ